MNNSTVKKKTALLPLGISPHFRSKDKIETRPERPPINLKRYYLGDQYPNIYLTAQEARCMDCFLQGMTDKQAAKVTQLAIGTVGFYLGNIRRKLNCNSKKQLVAKVRSSSFTIENGIAV